MLEDNGIEPKDTTYEECLYEAIKCHHTEFIEYFDTKCIKDKNGLKKTIQSLKYFNFQVIDEQSITKNTLHYQCRYGYFPFDQNLLKNENIDLNMKVKIQTRENIIERTLIDVAIDKENIEIVKLLLSNDYININLSSCKNKERGKLKYERTPLLAAVDIENLEIVQLLLSNSKYK